MKNVLMITRGLMISVVRDMFSARAREGGVLRRTGHTEATVDLCKLAGLKPVGILPRDHDEDGNMARTL